MFTIKMYLLHYYDGEISYSYYISRDNLRDVVKYFTQKYKEDYEFILNKWRPDETFSDELWEGEKIRDKLWEVSEKSLITLLQLPWYYYDSDDFRYRLADHGMFCTPYIAEITLFNISKYIEFHMEYEMFYTIRLTFYDELSDIRPFLDYECCTFPIIVDDIEYKTFKFHYVPKYKKNILHNQTYVDTIIRH